MTYAAGEPASWFGHDAPLGPGNPASRRPRPDAEALGQPQHADLTTALPVTPPRFGQLTHTSFHAPTVTAAGRSRRCRAASRPTSDGCWRNAPQGSNPGEASAFLGQGDIDQLPRRLVHGPVDPACPGADAYWHAVPAGVDSSGRPGNVFTHVLLDRMPDTPRPPLRPGDLLRSPVWLRPYGEEQVLDATVAGLPDPPWSDPVIDRTAVLGFLADRVMLHGGTLRGLLDAVHAAMQPQGPTVVLGVVDPADADRWVAAVGHLMSPGTSRRLYFSTAERVGGLGAARSAGLHLIVVPAAELRTVEPDDTVVLISDEDLPDGHPAVEFVDYDADLDTEQVHTTSTAPASPPTPGP